MSFRVWKGEEARTPRESPRPTPSAVLPPELLAAGAKRLPALALIVAAVSAAFAVLDRVSHLPAPGSSPTVWLVGGVGGIVLSLAVAWAAWREMLSPEDLLDLALVYEVAQALFFSLIFHTRHADPSRGWSAVAVWILVYPLIIPATRGKTVLATVSAALMDPLGLLVNVAAGLPAPGWPASALMFFPTVVAVAVALIISRIVYE